MISVLVANWSSGDRLRRLAATVPVRPDVELLVCDNASADGSAEGLPPHAGVERPGRNLGFGGALNLLAQRARGDVLLFLNPDCELLSETLPALQGFYDANGSAAMVGLHLQDAAGRSQERYAPRPFPTTASLCAQALGLRRQAERAIDPAVTAKAPQVAGAAMSVRRAAFLDAGGFDERFWPAWFEDVDLSLRFHAAGLAVWHCAEARVRHEGGYSKSRLGLCTMQRMYYGNLLRYAEKHLTGVRSLAVRAAVAAGMLGRLALSLVAPELFGTSRREAWSSYGNVLSEALSRAA